MTNSEFTQTIPASRSGRGRSLSCWRAALVGLALTTFLPFVHAQTASATAGEAQADAAQTVVLSDLPLISAKDAAIPGRFSGHRPYAGISDSDYLNRKANAATATFDTSRVSPLSLRPPASAATNNGIDTPGVGSSFNGINETCAFVTPSDMAVAVGSTYVLQVVNDCLAVFSKSGSLQSGFPKSVNTFFGLPPNNFSTGQFTSDPRLVYDWVKKRYMFVILWLDFPNSRGFVMVAASSSSDPRGSWSKYKIQVGSSGRCPDFPTLGQGQLNDPALGAFAVGFNIFPCNTGGFSGALVDDQVWFLPKAAIYSGAGFGFNFAFNLNVGGTVVDTVQPSNDQTLGDKPRAIFGLNSFNIKFGGGQCSGGCNGLVVWAFSNVLQRSGSPGIEISGRVISTPSNYSLPPSASQPGGANTIDSGDTRISGQVYYTAGTLWGTVNTNNGGGGPAVLAWQVHPTLNDNDSRCTGSFANFCPQITAATIDQEISYAIGGGQGLNAYYGTIVPDPERNTTMVFNFSGSNNFGSTAYVSNRITNPVGHWHDTGIFLVTGAAFYSQGRWGDYTGVANDLSSSTTRQMWFSGMYTRSDHNWGTAIGHNTYSSSNQP